MEKDKETSKVPINLTIGDMQVFIRHEWKSFHLGEVFENVNNTGLLPKARCWNGREWKRIAIRNHILGIVGLIDEDME